MLGESCRNHYLRSEKSPLKPEFREHDPEKWIPVFGPDHAQTRGAARARRDDHNRLIQPAVLETAAEGRMPAVQETVDQVRRIDVDQYKYGFETLIESDKAPKGLNDDTVRFISAKKNEPQWMLDWRLDAYRRWQTMREPTWAKVHYPPIDYQDLYYYSAPKKKDGPKSLDEIDPDILETYRKLGIPLREQEALLGVQRPANDEDGDGEGVTNGNGSGRRVAVDAVFDSVSVATTFQAELAKAGVLFMPISEALQKHPDLVKQYLGTVVPVTD